MARGYVRTRWGQAHYREASPPPGDVPALILVHGAPGSSAAARTERRPRIVAEDFVAPPPVAAPPRTTRRQTVVAGADARVDASVITRDAISDERRRLCPPSSLSESFTHLPPQPHFSSSN